MKLHVAYDQHGNIVAAAEVGPKGTGDQPVARSGISVAELEVPKEFAKSISEDLHRLHVGRQSTKVGIEELALLLGADGAEHSVEKF
jgi:hypothetical protein